MHSLLSPETVLDDTLNRFFQQSSQPSDALKFSTFIFSGNSMVLVLKTRAETATSLLRTTRKHLKTLLDPSLQECPASIADVLSYFLFSWLRKFYSHFLAKQIKCFLVYRTLQQLATFFPPSTSFNALYLSLMEFAFNLRLLAIVAMMMNQQESCK